MEKIRRTIQGIANMPMTARKILVNALLISIILVALAIIIFISGTGDTYPSFRLLRLADSLCRLSSAVLMCGVFRSVISAWKDIR